jgi:MFS family permease
MANVRRTGSRSASERLDPGTNAAGSHAGRYERDRRPHDVDPRAGVRESQRRQREEFGGLHWGVAFFGWLVAVGIATLLTALLSAAGAAVGLTSASTQDAAESADTLGIVGGVLLLVILLVAYYAGGYVAGRMSRFAGPRQGLGVWIIGLVVTVILAVAGALLGAEYNVLGQLNLPRIPVDEGSLTTGGLIVLAAIVLGTLLAAVAGGKAGTRFHRKVDRAGLD